MPTIKNPSIELINDVCSFGEFVISPIKLYTESLIKAKLTPMLKNNSLALKKVLPKYMTRHPKKTMPKPISMAFLYPSLGRKEAMSNDTMAIGKSLKASKIEALLSVTL